MLKGRLGKPISKTDNFFLLLSRCVVSWNRRPTTSFLNSVGSDNVRVVKWICPKDIEDRINLYNRFYYYDRIYYEADYNDFYEDAIIKELVDNQYIICGDTHQYMCLPIFNDDTYVMLSMRKWGEVMAKAMNLIEGLNKYTYIDFYLASLCKKEEKLPIK